MVDTVEASVKIESDTGTGDSRVVVYVRDTGETWSVLGECNRCGLCEIGAVDGRVRWTDGLVPGQAGACVDSTYETRKDVPMYGPVAEVAQAKMLALLRERFPRLTLDGCSLAYSYPKP